MSYVKFIFIDIPAAMFTIALIMAWWRLHGRGIKDVIRKNDIREYTAKPKPQPAAKPPRTPVKKPIWEQRFSPSDQQAILREIHRLLTEKLRSDED
jgi:hypothetical protein